MRFTKVRQMLLGLTAVALVAAGTAAASFPIHAQEDMSAVYGVFLNGRGWSAESSDNTYCQAPADSYVTAMKATLKNQPAGMTGTITYQVNLSGSGWMNWEENFAQTGSTTTAMPLEAVKIQLTGELADHYDIYYSVLQSGKWTDLVMNGQVAGVEGQGLRMDGLRVAVRKKGAGLPEEPKPAGRALDPGKPMVALTFDDGPSKYTPRILDTLEANGAKATFFMVGNRIGDYKGTVKRMVNLGCEPASHTWDHTYITKMAESALLTNLGQVDTAVQAASGVTTKLMRPPGGYVNDVSKATLAKKGVPAIMWSIDTLDWKTKNAQKTIDAVLNHVQDGDIVLMHDLYGTTVDAVEVIVPELIKRGYQLVTVSELASYRGGMTPGHTYGKFRP